MRVAITGGICDGKTTVLSALAEAGYPTFSADAVLTELYGEPTFVQGLVAILGVEAAPGGSVDRVWIRNRALEDDRFRRTLNLYTHAPVLRRVLARMGGDRIAFAEVPLLVEAAAQGHFDRVWVVDAGEAERRRRLEQRVGDTGLAERLLATQLPTAVKAAFADRILRTDAPLETVKSLSVSLARELG